MEGISKRLCMVYAVFGDELSHFLDSSLKVGCCVI